MGSNKKMGKMKNNSIEIPWDFPGKQPGEKMTFESESRLSE